jgi:hypothetical protein
VIPKISLGTSMSGLMSYLTDVDPERTHNVHQDPRLVAADPVVMAWYGGGVLSQADGRAVGRILDEPRVAFRVPDVTRDGHTYKHVWHTSLTLRPGEGPLSDARWAGLSEEFLTRMGFLAEGKAPVRYGVVRHGPNAGGGDHVHIAVSLVREDGTKASTWNDRPRAQAICRDLEREHGMLITAGRAEGRVSRGVSRAELERQARVGGAEPERRLLARVVRATAATAGSEAEFVAGLRAAGVRAEPWFAKGRTDIVEGYRVAARPEPGRAPVWLGGRRLSPDLSLPRLRLSQGWPDTAQDAAAAVNAWRGTHPATRRAPRLVPEAVWRARAGEVAGLRAWLDGLPAGDPAWTAGAGELAGVFAAWAVTAEGGAPGPLSAAADRLGQLASVRSSEAGPRPVGMPSGRGAARLVASAVRGGRGSVAQVALLAQLRDAAVAVRGAGQAEALARQAAVEAQNALTRLTAVAAPARTGSGRGQPVRVVEQGRGGWGR